MSLTRIFRRFWKDAESVILFYKLHFVNHFFFRFPLLIIIAFLWVSTYIIEGAGLGVLLLCFSILFLLLYKESPVVLISSLAFFFLMLFLSYVYISSLLNSDRKLAEDYLLSHSKSSSVTVDILNPIKIKEDRNIYWGKLDNGSKVYLKAPSYPVVIPGQQCSAVVEIERALFGDGFGRYLKSKRTFLSGEIFEIHCGGVWNQALFLISKFKQNSIEKLERIIEEPYASLVIGIMFGEDRVYSDSFEEGVRVAGLSHVVAASGFNVSFIVSVVSGFLFLMPRVSRFLLLVAILVIYTLISGQGASIMRAVIMWGVAEGFNLYGISLPTIQYLLFSCVLMLLINPLILLDIGFQLSFLATLGIVIASVPLAAEFKISENLMTSLVCTIFTAPVISKAFGEVSILGILSNILLLNSVEMVMGFGFLFLVFTAFFGDILLNRLSIIFHILLAPMVFVAAITANLGIKPIDMGYILPTIVVIVFIWAGIKSTRHNGTYSIP